MIYIVERGMILASLETLTHPEWDLVGSSPMLTQFKSPLAWTEGSYDQTPLWVTGQVCGRSGSYQPQVDDLSDHQNDREGFWELILLLKPYTDACRSHCPF